MCLVVESGSFNRIFFVGMGNIVDVVADPFKVAYEVDVNRTVVGAAGSLVQSRNVVIDHLIAFDIHLIFDGFDFFEQIEVTIGEEFAGQRKLFGKQVEHRP